MMSLRGRTVAVLMVLAMFFGSIVTITVADNMGISILAKEDTGPETGQADTPAKEDTGPDSSPASQTSLSEEQLKKILTTYELIKQRYYQELDDEAIIDGAISGMLSALDDPYSVYMDAEQAKQFNDNVVNSSFSGIGAEVTMKDGNVTIVAPIKGSPAEKAGVRAEDIVVSVNGESLEELGLHEAVMKIRGPKGTKAKLGILRGPSKEKIEIEVVRDDIDIETVHAKLLDNNIGAIEIRQFASTTKEDFFEELERLENEGMEALMIDLRNNPGGLLSEVIELAQAFVPAGNTIVQVEDRLGRVDKKLSDGSRKDYPIAVLINKGSASASEILAAAIQENDLGILVGDTTYGKGTVQSTFGSGVNDGSNLKITIAKWLTPKGNFIAGEGIEPDIHVELSELYQLSPLPREQELAYDDNSDGVATMQKMLEGLGYKMDRKDGYFDKQTEASLQAFQTDQELEATGVLDEETASKLEQQIIEKLMKPENDAQYNRALEYLNDHADHS